MDFNENEKTQKREDDLIDIQENIKEKLENITTESDLMEACVSIQNEPLLVAKQNIQLAMCLASLLFVRMNLQGQSESSNMVHLREDIDHIKQYFVKLKTDTEKPKISINKEASERVILHHTHINKKPKL